MENDKRNGVQSDTASAVVHILVMFLQVTLVISPSQYTSVQTHQCIRFWYAILYLAL